MAITKADLINSIYDHSDLQKREATSAVESLLEIIKYTLESGEDVLISGFGKFCVIDKNRRRGRNPQTGNSLILDARRVVTFKCSRTLRENLNKKKRRKSQRLWLAQEGKDLIQIKEQRERLMSKKYPECPLFSHSNCKERDIPAVCAIVREDKRCLKKRDKRVSKK